MSSRAVEDDAVAKAARVAEALYLLRDTYFPADPNDKISGLNADSDIALNLLDSIPLGTVNEAELVDKSIQYAKEAITLDVKDGNSWLWIFCQLEDVLMFYVAHQEKDDRMQSNPDLYFNCATEKDDRMQSNPDLYFNCATVNRYLENYERALSGFEDAALKDPGLNATEEV
ncbi:hypothetical protein C1H46_036608 [Malus baccata]|uniref:Uncharacterized protein n=1 Tax=Malus baccata TaxID=106549 RepID=A0A540KUF5_MALBA|nr:hypothetical protein C1H46_036608 [Malus baccata]